MGLLSYIISVLIKHQKANSLPLLLVHIKEKSPVSLDLQGQESAHHKPKELEPWPSSFQSCKNINFCWLSLSLWYFVMAAQAD